MSIATKVLQTLRSTNWISDCSDAIPDLDAGFDIQDIVAAEIAKDRGGFAGFKIAYNSQALMQKMAIPHPAAGRIFADQVYESGVKLDVDDYQNLMIEPEIAAVLAQDIRPGDRIEVDAIVGKIDRFVPAFEILNKRSVDGLAHVPTIVAHNVFNAGVVLGGPGISPHDMTEILTGFRDNNKIVLNSQGLAPQDPIEAAMFLAGHFSRRGQILPAGSILMLGAHCPLYSVGRGRELALDLGAMGRVSFST